MDLLRWALALGLKVCTEVDVLSCTQEAMLCVVYATC